MPILVAPTGHIANYYAGLAGIVIKNNSDAAVVVKNIAIQHDAVTFETEWQTGPVLTQLSGGSLTYYANLSQPIGDITILQSAATTASTVMIDGTNGWHANWTTGQIYNAAVRPLTAAEQALAIEVQRISLIAASRAEKLLLAHLNAEQRRTYEVEKYVDVRSASGKLYRLRPGHGNDQRLDDRTGKPLRRYCVYGNASKGSLPDCDQLFIKMLALRYDERSLLREANTWDERGVFVGQGVDAEAV